MVRGLPEHPRARRPIGRFGPASLVGWASLGPLNQACRIGPRREAPGPWYSQCPPFPDWGNVSPVGKSMYLINCFKYQWAINARSFQHVFLWFNSLFSGDVIKASHATELGHWTSYIKGVGRVNDLLHTSLLWSLNHGSAVVPTVAPFPGRVLPRSSGHEPHA